MTVPVKQIDIKPEELQAVRKILEKHVPEFDVCAFGSRVQWKASRTSDLDPVVMTDKPLSLLQLIDLKEDFSNSDLSFKVDLVDWGATSEDFKKVIEKQAVLIHKGNSK